MVGFTQVQGLAVVARVRAAGIRQHWMEAILSAWLCSVPAGLT